MLLLWPIEVLQLVTSNLEGLHIGRLWTCGNSALNLRLSARGVIHFHHVLDPLFPIVWPKFIRHFHHLESFEVSRRFTDIQISEWEPCIADLSPTLQKVTFCFDFDLTRFFEHVASVPEAFPQLKSISGPSYPRTESCLRVIRRCPQLSSISVPFRIQVLRPSDLPKHLVSVSLIVGEVDLSKGIFFPDSLETLSLEFWARVNKIWDFLPGLPVGLHSLLIRDTSRSVDPTPTDFALLPRSLKALRVPLFSPPSIALLEALPPNLTELNLLTTEDEYCTTDQALFWEREECAALKSLPRTLTRTFLGFPPPTPETLPFFPPNLATVHPHTSGDMLCHFPRVKSVFLPASSLPPKRKLLDSVTSLILGKELYYTEHRLPLALTDLTLHSMASWSINESLELPETIRTLFLYGYTPHLLPFSKMPKHLTSLSIEAEELEIGPEECEALPRRMKHLKLGFKAELKSSTQCLSLLPPQLESLFLSALSLDVGSLKELPGSELRKLTLIFFKDPTGLLAHDICTSLPPKLASFTYQGDSRGGNQLTDESLQNLPPGLAHLAFLKGQRKIKGTCKSQLPKSLVSLTITDIHPSWAPQPQKEPRQYTGSPYHH